MGIDSHWLDSTGELAKRLEQSKKKKIKRSSLDFHRHMISNLKSLLSILNVKEYFQINASASMNTDVNECLTT